MSDKIKELEEQLAQAKKEAEATAYAAGAAIKAEVNWIVEWRSKHRVYVGKKLTDETIAKTAAWRRENPSLATPSHLIPDWCNGGMTYVVIGNYLVSGGGMHVLRMNKEPGMRDEPVLLTDEEVYQLRLENVVDSLKYSG